MGRFIVSAAVAAILVVPAFAQVSTFDLSGTVLDPSSAVLPGATVSLKNTKTGLIRTEVTDERGRYHFIALPVVGEYSLKIDLSGFAADERAGLVFQARVKLDKPAIRVDERDVSLTPGMAVTAEIATARRRIIDFFLDPIRRTTGEALIER